MSGGQLLRTPAANPSLQEWATILNSEIGRKEPIVIGQRYDGTTWFVRFRAALGMLRVQVHVQSTAGGEGGLTAYDPTNYLTSVEQDCRADRLVTIEYPAPAGESYVMFLVPVGYDGMGTKIMFDGEDGRPDNMAFVYLDTSGWPTTTTTTPEP